MTERRHAAPRLVYNVALNLGTQALLMLVYVIATPAVVHGLGADAYGVLATLLAILGYFGFLDFGVSQATVKLISHDVARGRIDEVARVAGTSLVVNALFGVAGAALLALLGPRFLGPTLHLGAALRTPAGVALVILAAALPFVLLQGSLQGMLAADQRFFEINLLTGLAGAAYPLAALVIVRSGGGLVAVVCSYTVIRVLSTIAFALVVRLKQPGVLRLPRLERDVFLKLIRFGGWVSVSYIVGPLMVSADRVLIGWLRSAASVTYYSVPNDIAGRLLIVSGSLTSVLLPAFSVRADARSADGGFDATRTRGLVLRSVKLLLALLCPVVVVLFAFGGDLLGVWMGPAFAHESTATLRWLVIGALLNSVASIPFTAVWGLGRPDLTAKFHLVELPLYVGACFLLIPSLGIVGAGIAWTLRVALDLVLLIFAMRSLLGLPRESLAASGLARVAGVGAALAAVVLGLAMLGVSLPVRAVLAAAALAAYAPIVWWLALDDVDRATFLRALGRAPAGSAA
jgi:O-antigen/teichoic acid export membrane protein